jgi:hypothetical protein
MPAKCPLCFQKLDARQQLARVCLSHKERSENFPFDLDRKTMFCPVKTCENPRSIQTGVFLRHIGCPAKNPYWKGNGAGVVVPENDTLEREGKVFHVQHWMFGVLRELAEHDPQASEMWFPLHMFRTVNWYPLDERQGQQIGATIRLAGAKNAGKTVLATMALVPYGYNQPQPAPAFRVENFIYVSPEGIGMVQQPQEQFLQALLPFSMLRDQRNTPEWVAGTPPTRANIKAAFFRANVENRKLTEELWKYMVNSKEPWHSLLFYDTAGEDNEKPAEKHKDPVDIGAVVLGGSELGFFQHLTPPNAKTACERLATIASNRKCLIVTKVDLINQDLLLPAERELLAKLRAGDPVEPHAEREMLRRWLREPNALPAERDLAEQLSDVEVFFIWTEGLNDTDPGKLPQTFGLRKFVSWCLDGRFAPKSVPKSDKVAKGK